MTHTKYVCYAAFGLLFLHLMRLAAQPGAAGRPAASTAATGRPRPIGEEGSTVENTGLIYLGTAYAAFFLLLALYLDRLRRRDRELWRSLRELENRFPPLRKRIGKVTGEEPYLPY